MRKISAQRRERVLREHREWVHLESTYSQRISLKGYVCRMVYLQLVEEFVRTNKLEDPKTRSYFLALEESKTLVNCYRDYSYGQFRALYPEYEGCTTEEAIERANDNRKDNNQWFSLLPCGYGIIETHIPNHGY